MATTGGADVRGAEGERILALNGRKQSAVLVELLDLDFAAEQGVVETIHSLRGSFQHK